MSLIISPEHPAAPPVVFPQDRLLRLSQVMEMIALGRTRIYELVAAGQFPPPCKPGGSASRWSENEVLGWLSECKSQRLN
jgi:predicted DNA-binding transcriptional regulator AlpA